MSFDIKEKNMIKEEINICEIIEDLYDERDISLSEFRRQVNIGDLIDEITKSLNEKQAKMFTKLQDLQTQEDFDNQKRLIAFVLNFINATRK